MNNKTDYSMVKINESIEIIDEMRRNATGRFSAKELFALDWAKACMEMRLEWYAKEGKK